MGLKCFTFSCFLWFHPAGPFGDLSAGSQECARDPPPAPRIKGNTWFHPWWKLTEVKLLYVMYHHQNIAWPNLITEGFKFPFQVFLHHRNSYHAYASPLSPPPCWQQGRGGDGGRQIVRYCGAVCEEVNVRGRGEGEKSDRNLCQHVFTSQQLWTRASITIVISYLHLPLDC